MRLIAPRPWDESAVASRFAAGIAGAAENRPMPRASRTVSKITAF